MKEYLRMGQVTDGQALTVARGEGIRRLYLYDGDWEDKTSQYREITFEEAEKLRHEGYSGQIVLYTYKQMQKWCRRRFDTVENALARLQPWADVTAFLGEARRLGVLDR